MFAGMSAVDHPSLCAAFQATAQAHSDRPALRAFGGDAALTWGEYAARVEAVARGLWRLGVRPAMRSRCCCTTGQSSTWSTRPCFTWAPCPSRSVTPPPPSRRRT
jgi:hypothetical protein